MRSTQIYGTMKIGYIKNAAQFWVNIQICLYFINLIHIIHVINDAHIFFISQIEFPKTMLIREVHVHCTYMQKSNNSNINTDFPNVHGT